MDKFRIYLSTYPGGMCIVRRGLFLIIKTQYKHKDNRNRKYLSMRDLVWNRVVGGGAGGGVVKSWEVVGDGDMGGTRGKFAPSPIF